MCFLYYLVFCAFSLTFFVLLQLSIFISVSMLGACGSAMATSSSFPNKKSHFFASQSPADLAEEMKNCSVHAKPAEVLLKTKDLNNNKWKNTVFAKLFLAGYMQNRIIVEELKKMWKLEDIKVEIVANGILMFEIKNEKLLEFVIELTMDYQRLLSCPQTMGERMRLDRADSTCMPF